MTTIKQEAVFDRLQDSWQADDPSAVRRALTEHAVSSRDRRCAVRRPRGLRTGRRHVRRDLFQEECYLEDIELLDRLVEAKLQQAAQELAGSWGWVEVRTEFPYEERNAVISASIRIR